MGKVFDNSGNNNQNQIYDTSHRQYWAPPGFAPFKDNIWGFLGIVFCILLVGAIDIFLLHPIPAPEGTYSIQTPATPVYFRLEDSGTEYADAKRLSSTTGRFNGEKEIILVEKDGEIHLLMFDYSLFSRLRLQEDLLITGSLPQRVRIGNSPFHVDLTIDENCRIDSNSVSSLTIYQLSKLTNAADIVLGIAMAMVCSVILNKIKKSKNIKNNA